jgi:hypothetical protein
MYGELGVFVGCETAKTTLITYNPKAAKQGRNYEKAIKQGFDEFARFC